MTGLSHVLLTIPITTALAASAIGIAAQGQSAHQGRKFLPAAVTKAIQQNRPGAEIDKLDVDKEHGIVVYDIEFKAGQGEMDIAEDGTVLDIATIIDMKDLPRRPRRPSVLPARARPSNSSSDQRCVRKS